ncbi:glycoside hydrolase family 3 N-terminal domain-containing protein [Variovorax sp. EBFNA2]|uniref:glycoside hydrolase family 3 N-terminal domain-containing protein n=1 Tax=Variovorax sp. EBFNA2 TaxID=3342097 RepID=UPI0029C067C9|nr:glycoside hydrolase family 3 N-terminal domain-containing protein [Variovorax boronicumulans]WPG40257.1 glycoside hydrolase family 3 N-terminal domain-containing protein [Variovorax boronicumulans]
MHVRKAAVLALVLSALSLPALIPPATAASVPKALQPSHSPQALDAAEARIESLIARMTLQEKAGQLSLYGPADINVPNNPQAGWRNGQQETEDVRNGRLTGLFNNAGLEGKRRLQQVAVRESRLGIPLIFGADVIHGFRTIFPMPLAEASSWEPALAERTARAAAVEATADGFRWTFAPMVDIARDARWGRGLEGVGEDPYLARQFAAARVRGFQGSALSNADSMLATPKHFAAYGAAEGGLDYNTSELSERTLREVYLPPFRAALDAGALSVMSAFNEIGGVPSTANPALLTGVLRGEWKFKGFVVSDYTADEELIEHGHAANSREAAKLAFMAGTDVSMQSGLYIRHLPDLVASGEVSMARLDEAVRRVLRVKLKLGLFDDPMRGLDGQPADQRVENPEFIALARESARRSIVMLKNEGQLLPLAKTGPQKIALIGPFAEGTKDLMGSWSLFPGQSAPVGIDEGLHAALGIEASRLTVTRGANVESPLPGGIETAVAAARDADVVVLAIGESQKMSGESRSRTDIGLPQAQQDLAEAVAATGKPVVVLLSNGRAMALKGAVRNARAILVTWFLGVQTGHAIADVVFGDANPSGRLPVSFPQTAGQVPYYYAHKRTGRPSPESAPGTAFKTRYLDATNEALYPFGFGIGYAPVRYDHVELSSDRLAIGNTLRVRATVTNTGTREAEEVVQLYLAQRAASVTRPVRELKNFRKVRIAPGASEVVEFTVGDDDLQFLGRDMKPVVEPGEVDLWVAPSAASGIQKRFVLTRE